MAEKTLKDLLIHAAKDMYFAENAIYKALPKMIEGAKNADLKEGLTEHRRETKDQIGRLEKIFGILDMKPQTIPCEAIKGILKEGEEALDEFGGGQAGDPAVIFSCQAVEHYEINRYGSMRTWATELGMDDVAELLEESLSEEFAADDKLTALAEGGINEAAEGGGTATKAAPRRAAAKSSAKAPTKKSSRA